MKRNVLAGLALAVLTTMTVGLSLLGTDAAPVALLGAALGGVLGLVPGGTVVARVAGFLAGVALAWVGYLLRAAALPDSAAGRAVAALLVLGLAVVVVVAARGTVPLWPPLLGVAAVVGAFERVYAQDPTAVVSTSTAAVSGVLLAAALGLIATVFLGPAQAPAETDDATAEGPDALAAALGRPIPATAHARPRHDLAHTALREPSESTPRAAGRAPLTVDPHHPEA